MIKGAATADESVRPDDTIKLPVPIYQVRNLIFQLCAITGSLSALFWQRMPLDNGAASARDDGRKVPQEVVTVMVQLLQQLMDLSTALSIDLGKACMAKIALNNRKYPVKLCKVSMMSAETFVCTVYTVRIYSWLTFLCSP